jgi:hypothetical protein
MVTEAEMTFWHRAKTWNGWDRYWWVTALAMWLSLGLVVVGVAWLVIAVKPALPFVALLLLIVWLGSVLRTAYDDFNAARQNQNRQR